MNNLRKGTRCDAGVGEVGEVAAPDESTIVNAASNDTNPLVAVYNVEPNRVPEENQDRTPGSPSAVQDKDDVLPYDVNNFPNEELALDFYKHVRKYKEQRAYVNRKSEDAIFDKEHITDISRRRLCFTGDYCQNLELPHFGCDQPGETYYYCPVNINMFRLVDN